MDDKFGPAVFIVVLFFVIVLIGFIIGTKTGAEWEKTRQYEKCLSTNQFKVYNEAVDLCRNQVK